MINGNRLIHKLFFTAFLLTAQSSFAQYVEEEKETPYKKTKEEGFISIGVGFSNPGGEFKEQNLQYFYGGSGFAQSGYNINANYGQIIAKNLGFILMVSHSSHAYNTQQIEDFNKLHDPFATYQINVGRYRTTGLLGGLLLSFPLRNGNFDIKAQIGYSVSFAPGFSLYRSDSLTVEKFEINSSTSRSISSNIGVAFRFNINPLLAFSFSLDYYTTKPSFEHTFSTNTSAPQNARYILNMTMMNTSIGLIYRIRKY